MKKRTAIWIGGALALLAVGALLWFVHWWRSIPADLDECHAQLMRLLPSSEIDKIRAMTNENEMITYHFGLGMGLRNEWGLWAGSRLSRYFNRMGIHHPDDMSGVILETFWCKLHDEPFRLEDRVAACQQYWAQAKETDKIEKGRVTRVLAELKDHMQGLEVGQSSVPTARIPRFRSEPLLRVRAIFPFKNSVLITAREYRDWHDEQSLYTPAYILERATAQLRPIRIPEVADIENAVVLESGLYLTGTNAQGQQIILCLDEVSRRILPPPPGQGWLRLGIAGDHLLAVRPNGVHEWVYDAWQTIYAGSLALPLAGLPPERHGQRVYFRDEGRYEDDKTLWWLNLEAPSILHSLPADTTWVGPEGPRWEFANAFAVQTDGTLWVAVGRIPLEGGGDTLLRWQPGKGYSIALFHGQPTFNGDLMRWGKPSNAPGLVRITGFGRGLDGSLLAAGQTGIYRLTDRRIDPIVHLADTLQPDNYDRSGEKLGHWALDPTHIVEISKNEFVIGSHWEGVYLVRIRDGSAPEVLWLDETLGEPVTM